MVALNGESLQQKILDGERVSAAEALEIYRWPLAELGALADARRNLAKAKSYDDRGREIVTYIVDRNINYTNVCNVYCKFCAFYRTEKDDDHYVLSREQLDQKLDPHREESANPIYARARIAGFRRTMTCTGKLPWTSVRVAG